MIESLRTTQIAFFRFATPSGFLGGGDEVQKVFVQWFLQGKILRNHLWEHRFWVPDPRVFPPPGGRFPAPTTENRNYNWAAQAAQKKAKKRKTVMIFSKTKMQVAVKRAWNRWVTRSTLIDIYLLYTYWKILTKKLCRKFSSLFHLLFFTSPNYAVL